METDFATVALFADDEGRDRLHALDTTIAQLPGFVGATLAPDALAAAVTRLPADDIPKLAAAEGLDRAGIYHELRHTRPPWTHATSPHRQAS